MPIDTDYLLQRSQHEAVRSIQSELPVAAAIHQELCLLYVARVLARLAPPRRR